MTVTLNLEPKIEKSLETQARAHGQSIADYLEAAITRLAQSAPEADQKEKKLKLPALSLGDLGSLHRRDIYDDVR